MAWTEGRLPGGVEGGLRVARGAVLARSYQANVAEAGVFKHCEEDLPRHGAGDSVGPAGFVRRETVTDQPDVAGLQPAAGP